MQRGAPYGFCPDCGHKGEMRERRPNGNDRCVKGHVYASKDAIHLPETIFLLFENRLNELEQLCGEAYQVVGTLANAAECFYDPGVMKVLDNLGYAKRLHKDVLPFNLLERDVTE